MATDRPIFATSEPNKIAVLHREKFDQKFRRFYHYYGICNPCSGALCHVDELMESSYISIQENRLEYNVATPVCCGAWDRVIVLYYDRNLMDRAERAGFCTPFMTHMQCFPTCCDICGEGIVVYGQARPCLPIHVKGNDFSGYASCCCIYRPWLLLLGLQDAERLAGIINQAVHNRRSGGAVVSQQPAPVAMLK